MFKKTTANKSIHQNSFHGCVINHIRDQRGGGSIDSHKNGISVLSNSLSKKSKFVQSSLSDSS